jgi:hypothetical protein
MPETQEFISKIFTDQATSFTLLSDVDNSYALIVGLVVWLGDRVRKLYLEHGLHLDRYQGSGAWFVPIPATFVWSEPTAVSCRVTSTRISARAWKSTTFLRRSRLRNADIDGRRCGCLAFVRSMGLPIANSHELD